MPLNTCWPVRVIPPTPQQARAPPTVLSKLAGKAAQFDKAVSKAAGHLKRLGDENDQERYMYTSPFVASFVVSFETRCK